MTDHNPTAGNAPARPAEASPYDQLCIAISILQAHYLAQDSALVPEKIFGRSYMNDCALENAIQLLVELLPIAETLENQESLNA